jgi:hypothetical protein
MEPCPEAPTPWELVAGWFEGERTPSHYLAIVGMAVLPLLLGFGLVALLVAGKATGA